MNSQCSAVCLCPVYLWKVYCYFPVCSVSYNVDKEQHHMEEIVVILVGIEGTRKHVIILQSVCEFVVGGEGMMIVGSLKRNMRLTQERFTSHQSS